MGRWGPWVVILLVPALAGCSDDAAPTPDDLEPQDRPALAAGKGAIAGLLVDDRFRPLQLTDAPQSEFQFRGFILVQQTGRQVQTDANGVFRLLDLEPGTYTLRPAVDGHEGTPVNVVVVAGQYAEANLLVRRIVSLSPDTIITMDQTVMRSCNFQFLDGRYTAGGACFGDLSSDGASGWGDFNLSMYPDVTGVVFEYKFNQVADWEMWVTPPNNLVSDMYERLSLFDVDYGRHSLVTGGNGTSKWADLPFDPTHFYVWPNKAELGHEETYNMAPPPFDGLGMGLGFTFQYTTRIVMHAFLGENAAFDTYAILA